MNPSPRFCRLKRVGTAEDAPLMIKKLDEITLRLEGFAFEGKCVARVDGYVVFVPGGVPGDDARVRIRRVKKHYAEAELLEVLSLSPLRVTPRCKHFGTCGGCRWQHVDYAAQLAFKRQHVCDALERLGGFEHLTVNPTLGSENIYSYRNKIEFSFGTRWLTPDELEARRHDELAYPEDDRFALGMHPAGVYQKVIDLVECHLPSDVCTTILHLVRRFCRERKLSIYSTITHTGYLRNLVIRQSAYTGEVMVNLVTSEDRPEIMKSLCTILRTEIPAITTFVNNITQRRNLVALGDAERVYLGSGYITERIGKREYRISANSFFQINTKQAERLYDTVRAFAGLKPDDVVFDLYSGTGTIALHVADDVKTVIGIESVPAAVEDARQNAVRNGVTNCTFVLGDLKERLWNDTAWLAHVPRPSVIIVDPPRAGIHEKVVREILALSPERLVYVSCNPGTQARDLKLMSPAYRITAVQPVDMFPHTYHIENVVGMVRR